MRNDLSYFGPIWGGSGVQGFFGEGYRVHSFMPGLSFEGMTFVAKTTTFFPNVGNMPLKEDYTPKEFFPRCVWVNPFKMLAINAVGLSGPGLEALLDVGKWQWRNEPFFISYMPVGKTESEQVDETRQFTQMLLKRFGSFSAKHIAIQFNISCPNVGADMSDLLRKAQLHLDILKELKRLIVVKLNLATPPEIAVEIAKHPACSGLCIANTTPFGAHVFDIDWEHLFPKGSPLRARGLQQDGGLSGPVNFLALVDWIYEFRKIDEKTYLNAGNGITTKTDVEILEAVGANSISIASVVMFRPWRVPGIIQRAHEVFRY